MESARICGSGMIDIGPRRVLPGHTGREILSTEPGATFTHRHVYCVRISEDRSAMTTFLANIEPYFTVVDLMSMTMVLVQAHTGSFPPADILNHCVVRGRAPHTQTVHDIFEPPEVVWHLSNPDDYHTVEAINRHLERCGAIEVILVTEVRPVGVILPPTSLVQQRYDVWRPDEELYATPCSGTSGQDLSADGMHTEPDSGSVEKLVPAVEQMKL